LRGARDNIVSTFVQTQDRVSTKLIAGFPRGLHVPSRLGNWFRFETQACFDHIGEGAQTDIETPVAMEGAIGWPSIALFRIVSRILAEWWKLIAIEFVPKLYPTLPVRSQCHYNALSALRECFSSPGKDLRYVLNAVPTWSKCPRGRFESYRGSYCRKFAIACEAFLLVPPQPDGSGTALLQLC